MNEINIKYVLNRGATGNKDCNQCIRDVTTVNLSFSLSFLFPKARHATFCKGRLIQIKIQFEAVSLSSIPPTSRREGGGPLVML